MSARERIRKMWEEVHNDPEFWVVLHETIRGAAEARRWISVEDRLPELGNYFSDMVLVFVDWREQGGGHLVRTGRFGPEGWEGCPADAVTHWQPLPHPPQE